jgi:hypothetical protein
LLERQRSSNECTGRPSGSAERTVSKRSAGSGSELLARPLWSWPAQAQAVADTIIPKLVEQGFGSRKFAVLYRATWLSAKVATALNNADTPFARTAGNAASLTLRPAARIRKCRTCRRGANTSRVRASSKRQPIPSLRDACTKRLAQLEWLPRQAGRHLLFPQ